jgi:hypothetical protein
MLRELSDNSKKRLAAKQLGAGSQGRDERTDNSKKR